LPARLSSAAMGRRLRFGIVTAAAWASACAGDGAPGEAISVLDAVPAGAASQATFEADLATDFGAGASLLDGFDPPEPGADWRVGDRVLFGLRLSHPDQEAVRFVLLTARTGILAGDDAAEIPSDVGGAPPLRLKRRHGVLTSERSEGSATVSMRRADAGDWLAVHAAVFDRGGRLLGDDVITVAADPLRRGFFAPAAELRAELDAVMAAKRPISAAPDGMNHVLDVVSALFGFLDTLGQCPELERFRTEAVEKLVETPSFLSVLFSGGVAVALDPRLHEVRRLPRPFPAAAVAPLVADFPTIVSLNDRRALDLRFYVLETAPPLHLAAGIAALVAAHPSDPSRRLDARLLAARRGPEP
ncbi:MAG TPA: hypothetical protein VEI02_03050, partial [Planctomycetota bacterium]|nr:hypothetical protein [Planctomycetota bacterium]